MLGWNLTSEIPTVDKQFQHVCFEGLPKAHLNATATLIARDENAIASEPDRFVVYCELGSKLLTLSQ